MFERRWVGWLDILSALRFGRQMLEGGSLSSGIGLRMVQGFEVALVLAPSCCMKSLRILDIALFSS
eukprot:3001045-Ditylum_brightwellii.AAC.1